MASVTISKEKPAPMKKNAIYLQNCKRDVFLNCNLLQHYLGGKKFFLIK